MSTSHEAPVAAVKRALEWSFSCLYVFGKKFTLVFSQKVTYMDTKVCLQVAALAKSFPARNERASDFGFGAGLGDTHESCLDVFDLQVVLYRITCTALLAIVSLVERQIVGIASLETTDIGDSCGRFCWPLLLLREGEGKFSFDSEGLRHLQATYVTLDAVLTRFVNVSIVSQA